MLLFYAFIFVHCIVFYSSATEASINNNSRFYLISLSGDQLLVLVGKLSCGINLSGKTCSSHRSESEETRASEKDLLG